MFKRPSLHPERPFSGTGWRMQPSPPPQTPQYPIPPPGAGPPPYYLPPPMPPRKSRTALIVVIVVVIILVVGLSGAVYVLTSHTVHVTAENIAITGATNCWTSTTGSGETVPGGAAFTTTWTLTPNVDPTPFKTHKFFWFWPEPPFSGPSPQNRPPPPTRWWGASGGPPGS